MISVAEADRLLRLHARPGGRERVPLPEAGARLLAEEVVADRPYPPFDRVAMDGIAIAHAGIAASGDVRLRVASSQRAGEAPHRLAAPDECIEIMTGAALPEGCDTVVPYEHLMLTNGTAELAASGDILPGQNVHRRGSDRPAGDVILRSGTRLAAPHIAALASVGKAEVLVAAPPRIAILTTGDELVDVEALVLPHQIRRSNGPAIRAALLAHGYGEPDLHHVPDDEAQLRTRLAAALDAHDVVILSGGVSAGRYDFVPQILAELGVEPLFHKIRQKPGKPLWFGTAPAGAAVFGLPGNPISALVCLYRYTLPFLARLAGEAEAPRRKAVLTELPRRKNDFTLFLPVRQRGIAAHLVPWNGSGDFLSLVDSDGFVELAADVGEPGAVPYYSWTQS